MAIELVKENIEYEQLLGENTADTVVKAEYVIPDTHPDVQQILMLDAMPSIINTEVMQDKVYVEGQIEYNLLYLAKEEKSEVFSVNYTGKFSGYVDVESAEHKMLSESECFIEHIEGNIINERKVSVEGIVKIKSQVYNNFQFDIVKDIKDSENIELLKNPISVDKIVGSVTADLMGKTTIQIPMDKPEIGSILKTNVNVHKREVTILDDNIQMEAFALVKILYKGKESRELHTLYEDVLIRKEVPMSGVKASMQGYTDFRVEGINNDIRENDLGENRIIDIEVLLKANTKVMSRESIDMIEDAYSPEMVMDISKNDYALNIIHGNNNSDTIVKENISLDKLPYRPTEILMSVGNVYLTDKKLLENKILIEGLVNVEALFRVNDEEKYVSTINEDIPFSFSADVPGSKIDMQSTVKLSLESLDTSIEADTIAVKAVISAATKVSYITHKEFLVNVEAVEEEKPKKKASIIIYVVQAGDTLWKIAKKYSTTIEDLIRVNGIEDPSSINPGDKLIIPGRAVI